MYSRAKSRVEHKSHSEFKIVVRCDQVKSVWSKVNTYCQYLLVLLVNPKAIPWSSQAIRRNTKVANTLVGIGNPRQHFGRSRRAFRLAAEEAWRALIGWKSMGLGVRFHACSATPSYNIMTTQLSTLAADGSQSQYTPSTAPSDDLSSIRDDFTVLFAQTGLRLRCPRMVASSSSYLPSAVSDGI
jgi:hypothetical protein